MKARLVQLTGVVLTMVFAASQSAEAQPPPVFGDEGVATVQASQVPIYESMPMPMPSAPAGYGRFGNVPLTPHYQDGPARSAYDDLSGDRGGFYENSPMDEFVKDLVTDSFFRLEYLNWTFKKPGDVRLGSNTNAPPNPRGRYDQTISNQFFGEARIADTHTLEIDDVDGIRATIGIPLVTGSIEANVFWFGDNHGTTRITGLGTPALNNIVDPPQFVGTSTLTNGQLGTNFFLYDDSFRTESRIRTWGSEVNYLWDAHDPNAALQIRPLLGFRYYDQEEDFAQIGVFDQQDQLLVPLTSRIYSSSKNHVYAPQVGFRAELISRWLTLGLEPKLGFGVNDYEGQVAVYQLRSLGDPTVITRDEGARLVATGELGLYSKIHFNTNFSVTVGYQVVFIDNVTRPHDSILYNDNGPLSPPAVVANPSFQLMHYQGLSVGGELRF